MTAQATIENTNAFTVISHGNGWAFEFYRKADGASGWIQGDDAAQWRADYEAMQIASCEPESAWYGRNWNRCLAELIGDYLNA